MQMVLCVARPRKFMGAGGEVQDRDVFCILAIRYVVIGVGHVLNQSQLLRALSACQNLGSCNFDGRFDRVQQIPRAGRRWELHLAAVASEDAKDLKLNVGSTQ